MSAHDHIALDAPVTEGTARLLLKQLQRIEVLLGSASRKKSYTLHEAAERLGVAHSTLRVQANKGKIHAVKQDPENPASTWLIPDKEMQRLESLYIRNMKVA